MLDLEVVCFWYAKRYYCCDCLEQEEPQAYESCYSAIKEDMEATTRLDTAPVPLMLGDTAPTTPRPQCCVCGEDFAEYLAPDLLDMWAGTDDTDND